MHSNPAQGFVTGTSAAADSTGPAIRAAAYRTRLSAICAIAGGTATGQFKIQVSNDPTDIDSQIAATSWADLPGGGVAVWTSAPQTTPVIEICHRWVRVAYLYTGGAGGTISAALNLVGWP